MASQILSPKRKAIADSNRTMFIWVAIMSAVVGVCAVVAIFLAQQIMYKAKVIGAMSDTLTTLQKNNKVAGNLVSSVVAFEADSGLNSVKADSDEKALQVVLDALPADRNALALGASLQQNLLTGVDGITVESLSVDNSSSTGADSTTSDSGSTIPIQLQVSASNASAIKDMLTRMERSIRVIDIDNVQIDTSDSGYEATISAHAYYQPAVKVQLTDKTVPVKGGK